MAARQGDIVFHVSQNNDERRLVVDSVDEGIENLIGYEADELVGKNFADILLPTVNEIIDNYLEFEKDGRDLHDVLGRVRDFGFVTKLGYEVKLDMRIIRDVTDDEEHPRFNIAIRDRSVASEGSKTALKNFKGRQVIDKTTGLPDKKSFLKEAEFINFCVLKQRLVASIALIAIDGLKNFTQSYGDKTTVTLMHEVVSLLHMNFREDDILGTAGDNRIAVILLDADAAAAQNPLNRLRWQIASHPFNIIGKDAINITLSVAYGGLDQKNPVEEVLTQCEKRLQELFVSGGNKIAEVQHK